MAEVEKLYFYNGSDHVLRKILNFLVNDLDAEENGEGFLRTSELEMRYKQNCKDNGRQFLTDLDEKLCEKPVLLEENPFPYNAIPGFSDIIQYLVWIADGVDSSAALDCLLQDTFQEKKVLVFVNSDRYKSVSKFHAHLFVRR